MTPVTAVPLAGATTTPPSVSIGIDGVAPVTHAAVPTLRFDVRLRAGGGAPVRAVTLVTQIRIDAAGRPYTTGERDRLSDLFGATTDNRPPPSLLWTQVTTQVPGFSDSTTAALPVGCTYDFEVVATKYLYAVTGEVPLRFLFSGTVYYLAEGRLQVARLPWHTEAGFRMPARVWHDLMAHYFPGTAWLRLDRDTFDRLHAYRTGRTLLSWDDTVRSLLDAAGKE